MEGIEDRSTARRHSINPGTELDLDQALHNEVDPSEVDRYIVDLLASHTFDDRRRVDWLLRAVTLIDLTTLAGDDTPDRVRKLCATAREPLDPDLLDALGTTGTPFRTAAVCVYPAMLSTALEALHGSGIPVATVAAGFPAGLTPFELRVAEIEVSVAAGAREIDAVIMRAHVLTGDWHALYDEVRAFREAAGDAHLKVILATGELGTLTNVARAARICMMAGADFIKTSTGKEAVNATLPVGLVMARAIRDYLNHSGHRVGLKAAGGIRMATDALDWMLLVHEELGADWLHPQRFRIGASSLLDDINRQLHHLAASR